MYYNLYCILNNNMFNVHRDHENLICQKYMIKLKTFVGTHTPIQLGNKNYNIMFDNYIIIPKLKNNGFYFILKLFNVVPVTSFI